MLPADTTIVSIEESEVFGILFPSGARIVIHVIRSLATRFLAQKQIGAGTVAENADGDAPAKAIFCWQTSGWVLRQEHDQLVFDVVINCDSLPSRSLCIYHTC